MKGQKFITHGGERGVVLSNEGDKLFVRFFSGGKGNITSGDIAKFYPNLGRGRSRRQSPPPQTPSVSERPCNNCGNTEPHYVGGGHRCSMCDTEYLEGFKAWFERNLT